MAKAPLKGKEPAAKAAPKKSAEPKSAKTAAKPVAPKKTAQPAAAKTAKAPAKPATAKVAKPTKTVKKSIKQGDQYSCEICGLIVSVDEACGCIEACDIVCCGTQMKAKK